MVNFAVHGGPLTRMASQQRDKLIDGQACVDLAALTCRRQIRTHKKSPPACVLLARERDWRPSRPVGGLQNAY
jgi:hypothetical protein